MNDLLRLHVHPELRDPAMVLAFEGWNDAGESGTTALEFLNDAIHTVPLADIDPEEFYDFTVRRPYVEHVSTEERRIEWPCNEFRYGSLDEARELIIGIGVEPHLRWRTFCDCIVELATDMGVRRVVLVGAYLADVVYSQPVALTGFASSPNVLGSLGVNTSAYQGPTGIVGVLSERLQREGLAVTCLWAGLPHYIDAAPNSRGALALVQKLTDHLEFRVDIEPLRTQAAEFEENVSQVVANDSQLAEYVRQLKRREFAQ